jgi:isocitrate dehydrogenase
MPNLYGDILSDVAAQIAGSVGLAGSANIGTGAAMFEAIHGSAPRRAGQNLANPSGLLLGAVMMLLHIDQADVAERVHNAWLKTMEDGIHTYDIFQEGLSKEKVGTKEFAQAVAARVGRKPDHFKPVSYQNVPKQAGARAASTRPPAKKELLGVDVFLHYTGGSPEALAAKLQQVEAEGVKLYMISNRGVKVWPGGHPETFCSDHWRCRYFAREEGAAVTHAQIVGLLAKVAAAGFDFIKTDNLCAFDGVRAYSLEQGE